MMSPGYADQITGIDPLLEQLALAGAPSCHLPQRRPEAAEHVEAAVGTRERHQEGDEVMLRRGVEAASAGLADQIGLDDRDGAAVPRCGVDKPRIDIGADALVEPIVSKGRLEGVTPPRHVGGGDQVGFVQKDAGRRVARADRLDVERVGIQRRGHQLAGSCRRSSGLGLVDQN